MTTTITLDNDLQTMIEMAADANCPKDQVERFLKAGYIPLQWALAFHASCREMDNYKVKRRDEEGQLTVALGGARGPGKSHAMMAQIALDDCQRVEGLKFLFLRSLAKAAKESFEDVMHRVLLATAHEYSNNVLSFPNGSRIVIGGFKDDRDINKYIGIEYDGIGVEEATLLSEQKYQMLEGSLRTSKQNWRPRMYLSTNPGGIGHAWFKKRIVIPYREHRQDKSRFIPGTYRDNPLVNDEYKDYLINLPGKLGQAWRDGDFDIFEGQAFPQWSYDKHVVKPFPIPSHWPKWRGVDWGYAKPFCCLWFTKDPDTGRIYIYREVYATLLTDRVQARTIRENTTSAEAINVTYADPSMFSTKVAGAMVTSTAAEYAIEGVVLTKGDNNRIDGKRRFDRALSPLLDGLPGMQILENCINTIRTLPELVLDGEDVDTDGEDHAYDAAKYALTNYMQKGKPKDATKTHPMGGMFR